jgi:antagonist of KipI
MSILVLKAGLLDTIQDPGRFGHSNWGINPGGVMDRYAASVANMLVGNPPDMPTLEMHFPGPQLLFEQTSLISVCGGDFSPMLDDQPLPLWQPVVVRRNTALHFDNLHRGGRCYLAIHGGFDVESWLGSYSTHLKANAGGYNGRKLEKLDRLFQGECRFYFPAWLPDNKERTLLHWRADTTKVYEHPHEIYITEGREWNYLKETAREDFFNSNFIIHPSSDRMGYQLKGEEMQLQEKVEMISSGVHVGTIQLLPNGQLVILMADHQTTGGYPRIGHVISAHLPKLAQLRPSDSIQFCRTTVAAAEEMLFAQQKELSILQRACADRLKQLVC